jgi:hypothetical protein
MAKTVVKMPVQNQAAAVPAAPASNLPPPPQAPDPVQAKLRQADNPAQSCSTCAFYDPLSQFSNQLLLATDPMQVCDMWQPKGPSAEDQMKIFGA